MFLVSLNMTNEVEVGSDSFIICKGGSWQGYVEMMWTLSLALLVFPVYIIYIMVHEGRSHSIESWNVILSSVTFALSSLICTDLY